MVEVKAAQKAADAPVEAKVAVVKEAAPQADVARWEGTPVVVETETAGTAVVG